MADDIGTARTTSGRKVELSPMVILQAVVGMLFLVFLPAIIALWVIRQARDATGIGADRSNIRQLLARESRGVAEAGA